MTYGQNNRSRPSGWPYPSSWFSIDWDAASDALATSSGLSQFDLADKGTSRRSGRARGRRRGVGDATPEHWVD